MRVRASQGEARDILSLSWRMMEKSSSKAAASEEARRTLRYVEPLSEARTPLEGFCNILSLRGVEPCAIQTRQGEGEGFIPLPLFLQFGETMAKGRDKDRKTRKKHRKNVARVKALATARRSKGKKSKKG